MRANIGRVGVYCTATIVLLGTLLTHPGRALAGKQMLWVTNSAGDDVHIIDVAAQKVVKRLQVGPLPHGIAAPDNASVVYIALEGEEGEMLWVDPRSYEIKHRLKVGPRCNQLACTPDGRWAYIPCDDGLYWVVDCAKREVAAKIRTGGRPHNTQASRDGRFMYLSPMGNPRRVTVVDVAAGHKTVGEIPYDNVVRPPALSADGRRLYQNIDGLLGFQAADTQTRSVFATVRHTIPDEFQAKSSRCHGLAITPDQKEIWSCNVEHQLVHVHSLTSDEFPEIATIPMIGKIYWLCFTPDGKYAYVSVRSENKVAVVDCQSKKVLSHIEVGKVPKRNLVITLED
jgi:YVTN family beta-propeller protein